MSCKLHSFDVAMVFNISVDEGRIFLLSGRHDAFVTSHSVDVVCVLWLAGSNEGTTGVQTEGWSEKCVVIAWSGGGFSCRMSGSGDSDEEHYQPRQAAVASILPRWRLQDTDCIR